MQNDPWAAIPAAAPDPWAAIPSAKAEPRPAPVQDPWAAIPASQDDEPQYRQWLRAMNVSDADAPESLYDYRAAFRANARPDASGHWPSDFKRPGHPNEIVGGFNTRTGERAPGTPQASEEELVRLGWDPETAKRLSRPADDRSWFGWAADAVVPMATRIAPAVVGGVLGAAGGPLGIAGGGAAGAALGEGLAEGYEKWRGLREDINPTQIATQGALGAIPMVGRAGSVAKTMLSRAGQGALLGGASDVATRLAEGEDISLPSVAGSAALGAALGGGFGAVESRAATRAARRAAGVVDDVVPPMGTTVPDVGAPVVPDAAPAPAAKAERRRISVMAGTREIPAEVLDAGSPEMAKLQTMLTTDGPLAGITPSVDIPLPSEPLSTAVTRAHQQGVTLPPAKAIQSHDLVKDEMLRMFPEEQRPAMHSILEAYGGFEDMRRGVQPDARRDALAEHLVVSRAKNTRGTTLNDAQTKSLANTIVTINDQIGRMEAVGIKGGLNELEKLHLAKKKQEAVILLTNFIGARAEAGRALRTHQALGEILKTSDQRLLADAMRLPGVTPDADWMAKWAAATNDVERLKLIQDLQKVSWGDSVLHYVYANMLSGPKTHLRNLFGSTSNALFRLAASVPATAVDVARSAVTGGPRTHTLREPLDAVMGVGHGLREGLSEALFTVRNGFSRMATGITPFDTPSNVLLPRPELRGGGANPFNWPGRLLEAEDVLMAGMFRKMNQYARVSAKARNLYGGDQQKIAEMMADFKLRPDKYPEILKEAEAETLKMLFREEPGRFSKQLSALKNRGGGIGKSMTFVLPFVKVPSNILRQAAESNVVTAGLSHDFRRIMTTGTRREQNEAIGRVLLGTTGLATMAYWASLGNVSGAGPRDPRERAALMETGWRPNSIRVGDHWVDYTIPLQTIATPLSAIAGAWETFSKDGDEKSLGDRVGDILTSIPATVLDQSFLSGLSDFMTAMTSPQQFMKSWATRTATNLVPYVGFQRNLAQAVDPIVRDAEGPLPEMMSEAVRATIPGLSKTVDPRLTRFGGDATRSPIDAVAPMNIVRRTEDPLLQTLSRLGIANIATPPQRLGPAPSIGAPEIRLTLKERREIGRAQRDAVSALVQSGALEQMDPDAARALVQRVVGDARATVAARIRAERRPQ